MSTPEKTATTGSGDNDQELESSLGIWQHMPDQSHSSSTKKPDEYHHSSTAPWTLHSPQLNSSPKQRKEKRIGSSRLASNKRRKDSIGLQLESARSTTPTLQGEKTCTNRTKGTATKTKPHIQLTLQQISHRRRQDQEGKQNLSRDMATW